MVVARIEALIAGAGLEEALKRAAAYTEAGADGIMIHSRTLLLRVVRHQQVMPHT